MNTFIAFRCGYGDDMVVSYYGAPPGTALAYAVSKGWQISKGVHLCPRHSTGIPANITLGEN